jgi:hypothetical protein
MVDFEILSPQGEMTKLLGQFAALLILLSWLFSVPAVGFGSGDVPPSEQRMLNWSTF